MESYRDQSILSQLLERAPAYTVGYSPHYDDLVNYVADESLPHTDLIPFFLRKFQLYDEPTLAGWATETPVDQTIICAFSRCLPQNKQTPDSALLPETKTLERFRFCVTKVHCLDYLDFMIRVTHVITDKAIAYELEAWASFEDGELLNADVDGEIWYNTMFVPKTDEGQGINALLNAAASLVRRSGRMMEILGDQYRRVVTENIKLRPQHVAGMYFIPE